MAGHLRTIMLAPALVCLAAGLHGGLARMGVLKLFFQQPMLHHGSLMVVGFLAALIALERYFGGNSRPAALASGCFSLGGLALLLGELTFNRVLWAVGGMSFLAWACLTLYRFRTHFSIIFFIASAVFLGFGVYFYIQGSPSKLYSYAWAGFLTTFIAGERMDMLKIANAPKSNYLLAGASIPLAAVGIFTVDEMFMAAAFVSIFLTAAYRDVAVKFIWKKGFSRYLGVGLSTAYAWLMTAAVL